MDNEENAPKRQKLDNFKIIPGTGCSVDGFKEPKNDQVQHHFLTHFHADHYCGLTKGFSHGFIYCSRITSNLVQLKIKVPQDLIITIDLETPTTVNGNTVTFFDANHCPGAVIILFETQDGRRILHTGDFRASKTHLHILKDIPLDQVCRELISLLYLDTTYCKKQHQFPSQAKILSTVKQLVEKISCGTQISQICGDNIASSNRLFAWLEMAGPVKQKKSNTLYIIGSYTIGKERVWKLVAKTCQSRVFAEAPKRRVLSLLCDDEIDHLLTVNKSEAFVHVVGMNGLNKEAVETYLGTFQHECKQIVVLKPTGWTFRGGSSWGLKDLKPVVSKLKEGIQMYSFGIPYSEHSSYNELKDFCIGFTHFPKKIVPTVNLRWDLDREFREWKLS